MLDLSSPQMCFVLLQGPVAQTYDMHSVSSPQPAYPHNIQNNYPSSYSPAPVAGQRTSSAVSTTSVGSAYGSVSAFEPD